MASSTVLQDRQRHVGPNVALSYAQPIHMVSGRGCYLYDEDQQQYLDCVNNVAHVGHGNEQVGTYSWTSTQAVLCTTLYHCVPGGPCTMHLNPARCLVSISLEVLLDLYKVPSYWLDAAAFSTAG
jgi:hypothetical protein